MMNDDAQKASVMRDPLWWMNASEDERREAMRSLSREQRKQLDEMLAQTLPPNQPSGYWEMVREMTSQESAAREMVQSDLTEAIYRDAPTNARAFWTQWFADHPNHVPWITRALANWETVAPGDTETWLEEQPAFYDKAIYWEEHLPESLPDDLMDPEFLNWEVRNVVEELTHAFHRAALEGLTSLTVWNGEARMRLSLDELERAIKANSFNEPMQWQALNDGPLTTREYIEAFTQWWMGDPMMTTPWWELSPRPSDLPWSLEDDRPMPTWINEAVPIPQN